MRKNKKYFYIFNARILLILLIINFVLFVVSLLFLLLQPSIDIGDKIGGFLIFSSCFFGFFSFYHLIMSINAFEYWMIENETIINGKFLERSVLSFKEVKIIKIEKDTIPFFLPVLFASTYFVRFSSEFKSVRVILNGETMDELSSLINKIEIACSNSFDEIKKTLEEYKKTLENKVSKNETSV